MNQELKKEYVAAESQDPACRSAWRAYTNAFKPEARSTCATNLDAIRYAFYKRWAEAKRQAIVPSLKPVDED